MARRKSSKRSIRIPYRIHATMEPINATALYTSDHCQVWCSTQNAEGAMAAAAKASGLPLAQCDVIKTYLGGGFGRKGESDYVYQAVAIAKQVPGVPIKLLWSREEDTTHDTYHPVTQCRMRGALDADNKLVGLHMRVSGQSILASLLPGLLQNGKDPLTFQSLNPGGPEGIFGYEVPNLLIDHAMRNPPVTAGFWRGVNSNHNALYVESFMDELAHAAGEDPLAFRLKYLKPKHAAVLKAAAAKAGWGTPAPQGVYRGLAQIMANASYVAACAEVSVDNGRVKILRLVGATNSRSCRQSRADRAPSRRLFCLWAVVPALRRMHGARRADRADQFRYLAGDADRRNAEGRGRRHAGRRILGRRRRTEYLGRRARGAECHLRRDRQAHPHYST